MGYVIFGLVIVVAVCAALYLNYNEYKDIGVQSEKINPSVTKKDLEGFTKKQLLEKASKEFDVKIKTSLKKDEVVEELLKLYK